MVLTACAAARADSAPDAPDNADDSMDNSRLDKIALITKLWPWLFLCALLAFFEAYAQVSAHRSFVF
jgi:hypothetical protein